MRRILVATVLLLSSCGVKPPPSPPEYADDCAPSHTWYHDLAASTADLEPPGAIPLHTPEAAENYCRQRIEERGWTFIYKEGGDPESVWSKIATTGPNIAPIMPLPLDFDERPPERRAYLMCHELAHTMTWERLGDGQFLLVYPINEGTWSVETIAQRQRFRVWLGLHPEADPEYQRSVAEKMAGRVLSPPYSLKNMPAECVVQSGADILMREVQ